MLDRFNEWFDNLQGPERFLTFIVMMVFSVCLLHLGVNLRSPIALAIGFLNTAIVVAIATSRAFAMGGAHRKVGFAMTVLLFLIGVTIPVLLIL